MKVIFFTSLLLFILVTGAFAQAKTNTGFYYPTGTATPPQPGGAWLATGCDTYDLKDGINHYHLGFDLLQAVGQPVHTIADGLIVYVASNTDPDLAFIWIQHQAIDPNNGQTITFWAVYGHTTLAPGLAKGSVVHANDIIGTTMPYPLNVPHCHFAVNRIGIVTTVTKPFIPYLNSAGQNSSAQVQVGWGRGADLPGDWCMNKSQNLQLLQQNSAPGLRGYVDPLNFIRSFKALGYVPNNIDLWVDGSHGAGGNGTQSSPFNTVENAVNAASSTLSVIIHITPGWYHENISSNKHIKFITNGVGTVRIGG